jgi:hypothetical protein
MWFANSAFAATASLNIYGQIEDAAACPRSPTFSKAAAEISKLSFTDKE